MDFGFGEYNQRYKKAREGTWGDAVRAGGLHGSVLASDIGEERILVAGQRKQIPGKINDLNRRLRTCVLYKCCGSPL